jgi:protein-L-isoaspartate(D-aspartate) O-methyltransferase
MLWGPPYARVQRAMQNVPRGVFLPPAERRHADEDTALPIEHGQTISQPSLVAQMTAHLELTAETRVLEIGTGSGYQTAILAELAGKVFTIERIEALSIAAQCRLAELGYRNIRFRVGDGASGWPEYAPFEAIIVTAAPLVPPPALVAQLARGGRMVVPVGAVKDDNQRLLLIRKEADGTVHERELCGVRFVPLITDSPAS